LTAVITQIHGAIDSPQRKLARQKALFEKGFLKLNFEIIQKNAFSGFCQKIRKPWMKLKFFFANFQILGSLGCQGWVVIPQNVKKSKNHCTLIYSLLYLPEWTIFFKPFCDHMPRAGTVK